MKELRFILIVIITLVMVNSCIARPECDPENSKMYAGICFSNPVSYPIVEENVERIVTILEEEVQRYYPDVTNLREDFFMNGVRVKFIANNQKMLIDCEKLEGTAYSCNRQIGGVNINGNSIYLIYNSCIAHTALAHELMHSIQHHYDIPFDYNNPHKSTPWFFTMFSQSENGVFDHDKIKKTVERRVGERTQRFCALNSPVVLEEPGPILRK